jgi:hypothetical protein
MSSDNIPPEKRYLFFQQASPSSYTLHFHRENVADKVALSHKQQHRQQFLENHKSQKRKQQAPVTQ